MITYKSGNEIKSVSLDSIHSISSEDLGEVYDALSGRIKISREDFINGDTREINQIKVSAVNLYYMSVELLEGSIKQRRERYEKNLRKRFGVFAFANKRSKSAQYVSERLEELEHINPTVGVSYLDLRSYCTKDYDRVKKDYALFNKRLNAKLKILNGQDYDKYLKGAVTCSKEEYAYQNSDYTRRMKAGLEAAKDACRFVRSYVSTYDNETRKKLVAEFGEGFDEDKAIARLFQHFKDVSKLNIMGYERLSATDYRDLVAYVLIKDKFRELVRSEDSKVQRQLPEVYKDIRRNPKFNERFGSMIGNFDNMSIDLMLEIYHTLLEVNDMNSYKGINIDPAKYMYLSNEEKENMRRKVLFQMRKKFEHMSDKELEQFLTEKTNLFLLDAEDRKEYLSRARNIIINSVDLTSSVVNNEELLYQVQVMMGRRTPTAVFEFVNNAQVSRFMYRKMYNSDLDLTDINNLLYTQRIAASYSLHKENQKAQALREQMAAQDRKLSSMVNDQMMKMAQDTMRRYNNMMFREKPDKIREDTFKFLIEKYPDKRRQEIYRHLSEFLGDFIRNRDHDYTIFDELTPEIIDASIYGKKDDMGFMFDVVKPEEDSQGTAKK